MQVLIQEEQQETFQDAEFAVALLKKIKMQIPENEMHNTAVEVNAKELRNCMELMLSLLEGYEGLDVSSIEAYQEVVPYFGMETTQGMGSNLH